MNDPALHTIAEAFSRTAAKYDAFAENHPHLSRLRSKVYEHLGRLLPAGSHILELNAGTGTDAVQLALRGYHVHATDIAEGMLSRLPEKARLANVETRLTFEQRSFLELGGVPGAPFDALFSDLGGLNCIPDLRPVIEQLPAVLRPGGLVTWVLMPPVCLWELGELFRGHARLAFRRLARGPVHAALEGLAFNVWYFPPRQVIDWFGADYQPLALEGLSVFTPTAESRDFAKRHAALYRLLSRLDDRLAPLPPWRALGDFYILSMRRRA